MSSEHDHEVALHIKKSKLFLFNTTKINIVVKTITSSHYRLITMENLLRK